MAQCGVESNPFSHGSGYVCNLPVGHRGLHEHRVAYASWENKPVSEACASGNHYRCNDCWPECWCPRCHAEATETVLVTDHEYKHPDVAGFDLPLPCKICYKERREHARRGM